MQRYVADLHVHTLLSPCAAVEMTPRHIMLYAKEYGLDILAITDHNVSANVLPAVELGARYGIVVWPGVEVESSEGAHIVVLFDSLAKLNVWQSVLDANMTELKNNAEKFGGQFVVDAEDEFIREETRLLLAPTGLSAQAIVDEVGKIGGVCIAAHIDRPAHSLLSYFGFIPPELALGAVELSRNSLSELAGGKYDKMVNKLPYLTNSDAHSMEDFIRGPKNHLFMQEPTIEEFLLAAQSKQGRYIQAGKFFNIDREI